MSGNEEFQVHDGEAFTRETLTTRMNEYGFKNMGRLELFLWDLEMFLQIQNILGERIVLKGGAAVQFYLPMEVQRTSVDIDMIFCGTKEEIDSTLTQIESKLAHDGLLFRFKQHKPKNPKTELPLYTYYTKVPTVLTTKELNVAEDELNVKQIFQEIKIEFIQEEKIPDYVKRTGENIFAVNSPFEYQILSLSQLFADKLTTIGCNTIGVQNDRMDEQVKQFYDVMMISKYCMGELVFSEVKGKYLSRAEAEWKDRSEGAYDLNRITEDVRQQLDRYSMVDGGEDPELKKYIADFNGLYLNSKVQFTPQNVSCAAMRIRMMYDLMIEGEDWHCIEQAQQIEAMLELPHFSGRERGIMTKELRIKLVENFAQYSSIPANILKSKPLRRVFWAIAKVDNLDDIQKLVSAKLT